MTDYTTPPLEFYDLAQMKIIDWFEKYPDAKLHWNGKLWDQLAYLRYLANGGMSFEEEAQKRNCEDSLASDYAMKKLKWAHFSEYLYYKNEYHMNTVKSLDSLSTTVTFQEILIQDANGIRKKM